MATAFDWKDEAISDLIWALSTSLNRVSEKDLSGTHEAEYWKEVQDWLTEADAAMHEQPSTVRDGMSKVLPTFPLQGGQLRDLQAKVDEVAQAHAAQQAPAKAGGVAKLQQPVTNRARLHWSLEQTIRTSAFIAAFLGLSFVMDVVTLILFHGPDQRAILGINLSITVLGIAAWVIHNMRLKDHAALVHAFHPRTQGQP